MSLEILRVQPAATLAFFAEHQREALKTFYNFSVIWHEQSHDVVAKDGETIVAAARLRIAASLGRIERLIVAPDRRRQGIARLLLDDLADLANYYNCHKMTILVPHRSAAQTFFEACGYREEAVLPQHTFKLDMAAMRKFLL
ncbi:MAG TPA: GNAT family N-acetyltransferase [Verrucomicrobiae bacterium]|nr:GNAT family N-acetyltransferase [Verrucomicrobiae bacterium]